MAVSDPAAADLAPRLRRLPAVDEVLRGDVCVDLLAHRPRWAVVRAVREAIDEARQRARRGEEAEPALDGASLSARVTRVNEMADSTTFALRPSSVLPSPGPGSAYSPPPRTRTSALSPGATSGSFP